MVFKVPFQSKSFYDSVVCAVLWALGVMWHQAGHQYMQLTLAAVVLPKEILQL